MSETEAKYRVLQLLLAAAGGGKPVELTGLLETVCVAVGLDGCALAYPPYEGDPEALAGSDWARQALRQNGQPLWQQLVSDHQLESAFMQLSPGGDPQSLFAYPLKADGAVVGAVLGLVKGRRNLALEEEFLLALATALTVAALSGTDTAGAPLPAAETLTDAVEKARQAAILETAIAVNHEVNNPLTAVLGNTQLMLLQADALDEKMRKRLRDIEKSALRIKEVTQKLLKEGPKRSTDYPGGLRMLDLADDESPPPDPV